MAGSQFRGGPWVPAKARERLETPRKTLDELKREVAHLAWIVDELDYQGYKVVQK